MPFDSRAGWRLDLDSGYHQAVASEADAHLTCHGAPLDDRARVLKAQLLDVAPGSINKYVQVLLIETQGLRNLIRKAPAGFASADAQFVVLQAVPGQQHQQIKVNPCREGTDDSLDAQLPHDLLFVL